jgi:5,10-methylenetetrahydromethanopterin reductase
MTSLVRFGLVRPARFVDGFEAWVTTAEDLGFELFGFGDSQTMWGDPYVAMALAARHSRGAAIGPWVTVPFTRHPTVAASSIATIQQLSGGRAFFGIGPGDSALYNVGRTGATLAEMAAYAAAVKGLCAGEEVEYDGTLLKLHWPTRPVPVWMAGDGEKALQLAGAVADGVIVGNAATPELVRFARDNIEQGARSSGRSIDDLQVWYMVRIHIAPSEAEGISQMRFYLASYANVRFRKAMRNKGVVVTDDLAERIEGFRREFHPDDAYNVASQRNVALLDKWGLTDWLARQFLVTGPPDLVVARVRELVAAGATNLAVPQMLPDLVATTHDLAEHVLAGFVGEPSS